jgi:hypothetical protein
VKKRGAARQGVNPATQSERDSFAHWRLLTDSHLLKLSVDTVKSQKSRPDMSLYQGVNVNTGADFRSEGGNGEIKSNVAEVITLESREKYITLPCDCKCCMFVISKTQWEDGDINYNIMVQDSRLDDDYNTVWGRIKRAFAALFGKPVTFNDVFIREEAIFRKLIADMTALADTDL